MKLRVILQVLVIFFVISSLFIFKSELSIFSEKIKNIFNNREEGTAIEEIQEKIADKLSQVSLPGPLRDIRSSQTLAEKMDASVVIQITNQQRQLNGSLPPLKNNFTLSQSAMIKARDMLDLQYFEHESPFGVAVGDLARRVGYGYISVGENLAMGTFRSEQDLVNAWMNSPGHRANILNKNYTEIGVAVIRGVFEGKPIWMSVQHFGRPLTDCP